MAPDLNTSKAACYFPAPLTGVHALSIAYNLTRTCKSTQCARDRARFLACPIVRSYGQLELPHATATGTAGGTSLSMELRRRLRGRRLAIFGDSMARQVFSVLIGLLRGEDSFLDFHTWNPARYRLWLGRPTAHDQLDLFHRPLTFPSGNRSDPKRLYSDLERQHWNNVEHRPDDDGYPVADVDVSWIPMPLWSTVTDAFRIALAAERASQRAFELTLVFVPSAWQLDAGDANLLRGQYDTVPGSFWNAWRAWREQSPAHARARYAALTMPMEHISECIGKQRATNNQFIRHYQMNISVVARVCPRGCCLGAATAARNELRGMPESWRRIDFAAITRAKQPAALVDNNWHYECILERSNVCHHRPLARMGVVDDCNLALKSWFANVKRVGWTPRVNGDCAEDGNTLLWTHLAHDQWLKQSTK
jgi:hypothetical protein